MQLSFSATTDGATVQERLDRLLVRGPLRDAALQRRIERVDGSFRRYAGAYPLPFWGRDLVLDQEMRALTEALFPLGEIAGVFRMLLSRGCRFTPLLETTVLCTASCWLDVLQALELPGANPAPTLALLAEDEEARRDFLFSLFLPRRYGASFDRYPVQAEWLGAWLREECRRAGGVRALDCACGSGEGTYRLAELLAQSCADLGACSVHGSTFEPLELCAGAHAYFPHDAKRQAAYRERIAPLSGGALQILFYLDDVATEGEGEYDVILCNGLLGGPMLSEPDQVAGVLAKLAARLAPGGVLLAADRFHAGWKRRLGGEALVSLLARCGLAPLPVPEGIGGRKGR